MGPCGHFSLASRPSLPRLRSAPSARRRVYRVLGRARQLRGADQFEACHGNFVAAIDWPQALDASTDLPGGGAPATER